jgi:hypothetical protein
MKKPLLFLLLLIGGPVQAAPADYAGRWLLRSGEKSCDIRLDAKPVRGGFALVQKCSDAFPVQSAQAWKPFDGGIVFLSETGAPVVTFQEQELGLYGASNDPGLFLRDERDAGARVSQKLAVMAGAWTLGAASGPPMCSFAFAGKGTEGTLTATDPCRPEWRAKHYSNWTLAGGELALKDAGGTAVRRYRQRDPNTFTDILDLETPLMLWRPVR